MNKEIKTRWVSALRSGDYIQGTGDLCSPGGKYCCLGVLTDLYAKEHDLKFEFDTRELKYNDDDELLCKAVQEWAGIEENNPSVRTGEEEFRNNYDKLSSLNDDGMPFDKIADLIEEQL